MAQLRSAPDPAAPDDDRPLVIITTTGAVSGKTHAKPLCVREDGADLIIAASAGGAPKHPQWYRNLVAQPSITVEYRGQESTAVASTVTNSPDRDRLFNLMSEVIPGVYEYQDLCRETRQIPIVRLRLT